MKMQKADAMIVMATISFIICEGCIVYAIHDNQMAGMTTAFFTMVYMTIMTKLTSVKSFDLDVTKGEISVNEKGQQGGSDVGATKQ